MINLKTYKTLYTEFIFTSSFLRNPFFKYTISSFILLAICLLTASCGEESANFSGLSENFITPSNLKSIEIDSVEIENYQTSNYSSATTLPTLGSLDLPEGRQITFTAYYNFDYPDTTFSALNIQSVESGELQYRVSSGSVNNASLSVDAFRVTQIWKDSSLFISKQLPLGSKIFSHAVSPTDTSLTSIALPIGFVNAVIDAAKKGRVFLRDSSEIGIALRTISGKNLINISRSNIFLKINLNIQTSSGIERRVITLNSTASGNALERNFVSFSNNAPFIQASTGDYSRLKFNLTAIPKTAEVVSAELSFHRDTLYFAFPTSSSLGLNLNYADSARVIGRRFASFSLFPDSAARYRVSITPISQIVFEWVRRPEQNLGFIVTPFIDGGSPFLWKLYGNDAATSLKPRLKVIYISKD
ncbi:MAG: hypothetical protein SFU91_10285 [Chloroherpetonaceae bacterium]|nr:hypothetical protein [Chloroherpetonaceae bacterium]